MANNHKFVVKNGLQTQNISFVDSDKTNTIYARMLSNDALAFSGNAGQLFSISDSLSGTIFAVNDISGVPSIEVDDDGEIRLAETFGHVLFGTDSSLDTSKYIVQIAGGLNADSATIDGSVTASSLTTSGDITADTIYADGGNLIMGDEAYSTSAGYVGMKTSNMSGSADYMIISGTSDGHTYVSAKNGSSVFINAGGNDGTHKLGVSSSEARFYGDLTVDGDLTISGTTTTINTETINLADNIIVLNSNETGTPSQNAGIEVERGTSTNKVFQWNETSDYWEFDDNIYATGGTSAHRLETSGGTATLELRPESTHTGWHPNLLLRSQNNGSVIYMLTNGNSLAIGSYNGGVPSDPSDFITFKSSTSDTPELEIGDAGSTTSTLGLGAQDIVGTSTGVGIGNASPSYALDVTGTGRFTGDLHVQGGNIYSDTSSQRVKYHTYSTSTSYGMGMQSGVTFGGMSDWSLTFQMDDQADRGFWWGDAAHSTSQGAMALTTEGKLTVAHSARIGYGEADTTIPGASYTLDITGGIVTDTIDLDSATFTGTTISLRTVDSDGTQVSALSFEGDAGQLFSIVDSMGGTIFSVNDISGIPSIEVDDDGQIRLAEFGGEVLIGTSTDAGNYLLQVAGNVYSSGTYTGNGSGLTNLNASNIASGTIGDAYLPATISSDITGNAATVTATANNSTNETVYLTFVDGATGAQGIETDTSLVYNPSTNLLAIASDTDISAEIGRAHIGYVNHSDWAGFSHVDQNTTTSFALMQNGSGRTILNSASGQVINFRTNNTDILQMNSSGLFAEDDKYLAAGSGQDLQIYHNATSSFIVNYTGGLTIRNGATDADVLIETDNGSGSETAYFRADGSTGEAILYHYGTEKFKTSTTGAEITGDNLENAQLVVNGKGGSGSYSRVYVYNDSDGAGHPGAIAELRSTGWGNAYLRIADNYLHQTSGRFEINHGTTRAWFNGTANVGIATNSPTYKLHVNGTLGVEDSAVVSGNITSTSTIRSTGDDAPPSGKGIEVRYRTGDDVGSVLSYDRSSSSYKPLLLEGSTVSLREDGTDVLFVTGGNVGINDTTPSYKLDVNGTGRFTGTLTLDANLDLQDNDYIYVGTGNDLRIHHNGSTTYVDNYTGNLEITNQANDQDIVIQSDNGSGGVADYFRADGSTGEAMLYHYGSEKLNTSSTGIQVTGTSFNTAVDVSAGHITAQIGYVESKTNSSTAKVSAQNNYGTNIHMSMYYGNSYVRDESKTGDPGINFVNGAVAPSGGSYGAPSNNYHDFGTTTYRWKNIRAGTDITTSGGNIGVGNESPAVAIDASSKTDAIGLPSGTTAERPGSAVAGQIRWNEDTSSAEIYDGTSWGAIGGGGGVTAKRAIAYSIVYGRL